MLLFSALLYGLFRKRRRPDPVQETDTETLLSAVLLFILIFGFFSYPFDRLPFILVFVSALALRSQNHSLAGSFRFGKKRLARISLFLLLCLVSMKMSWEAYRCAGTCRAWNQALSGFAFDREASLSRLKALYPDLASNPVFLITYGTSLSFAGFHKEAAPVLEKAIERLPQSALYIELGKCYEVEGFPEQALACWEQAAWMVPVRFTPLYLSMQLHFKNGEYDQAREYADRLLSKTIKIDHPEIDRMRREAVGVLGIHTQMERNR